MRPNVIILTGGDDGSSVLTGLIARAGFWTGTTTVKVRYETFENSELVNLDVKLLKESGYSWKGAGDIPPPSVGRILQKSGILNLEVYEKFIKTCNANAPWIWKDPRLCYTIFFWRKLVDMSNCKFMLMTRDLKQTWTSMILKGTPISFNELRTIQNNCIEHAHKFFIKEKIKHHALNFEDLILNPEGSIKGINKYLGINLEIRDLAAIYKGPLYCKRWSKNDYMKAKFKWLCYKYILGKTIKFPRSKFGK